MIPVMVEKNPASPGGRVDGTVASLLNLGLLMEGNPTWMSQEVRING